jgi:hypothetical protein
VNSREDLPHIMPRGGKNQSQTTRIFEIEAVGKMNRPIDDPSDVVQQTLLMIGTLTSFVLLYSDKERASPVLWKTIHPSRFGHHIPKLLAAPGAILDHTNQTQHNHLEFPNLRATILEHFTSKGGPRSMNHMFKPGVIPRESAAGRP